MPLGISVRFTLSASSDRTSSHFFLKRKRTFVLKLDMDSYNFIHLLFFIIFGGHMSFFLFAGPLIPLFWTSGDVCPGFFKARVDSLARFLACALFLRFTSGATPANILTASMVTHNIPYMVSLAEVGCQGSNRWSPDQHTDVLPTWPLRPGLIWIIWFM